jgi:methylenetetrahydrofolate reductase (NADPH)
VAPIAGFHLFSFGGLRKAGEWLRTRSHETLQPMERAAASGADPQNP